MNISKSVSRLKWRFSQGNSFKPNQTDIDCFNELIKYAGEKEKQQLIDNQLFGKMYIYLFTQFVKYYKCTVEDSTPQKELHKLLDKNIKQIVEEAKDDLNLNDMENIIKTEDDLENYKPLTYDECAENFRIMINAAINTYSRKPYIAPTRR